MSERGKRVVRVLFDRERDADVIERIESNGSITGYLRTLVRRDIHDERLDYAAMKTAEYQSENAKLRELVRHMHTCLEHYEPGDTISCEQCPYDNETWGCDYERLMAELGVDA